MIMERDQNWGIGLTYGMLLSMSSTLERLRRLHNPKPQRERPVDEEPALPPARPVAPAATPSRRSETRLEALVPGMVIENENGLCYLVTERFPVHVDRGNHRLADLLRHHPMTFAPFHPTFGLHDACDFRQAIFLDTETTGLGGGAGVYCFMVGVGAFEPAPGDPTATDFVVRQFFMRQPGEEGALLFALTELLEAYGMSVTFNGRTFDLPLLRTRLRQNQHIYPELRGSGRLLDANRPHLDLLHPARRLWKRRLQSCRLINLEGQILGLQRSEEDVPGSLIPQLYVDYLRTNDASAMRGIFYHNREDIVSMVGIAAALCGAYSGESAANGELHGLDWLALGHCYEGQQQWELAEQAFCAAAERLHGNSSQAAAFAGLAALQKRLGRWAEAAATWERWLSTVPGVDVTPYVELAKYAEWQCKDPGQAAMWTGWALHLLRNAPAWQQSISMITDLEHRLARLQRKLESG